MFHYLDLVGVDVAITIEDEVFDKDLENKSSTRYKKIEKEVEEAVRTKKREMFSVLHVFYLK